jgi:RNA polymerase sigma-70 factor (ECF subfamily)
MTVQAVSVPEPHTPKPRRRRVRTIRTITATSTSLLSGLARQDDRQWREFVDRYQPVLVAFARKLGLSEQDAADAAQDTLLVFAVGHREGKYDRSKGRLRTWLLGIATNKIREIRRKGRREFVPVDEDDGTRLINQIEDDHTMSDLWEEQWREAVLEACLKEVREQVEPVTMRAFELFVLQEWPAEKVASELGISANAVFKGKRRVLTRMHQIYKYLEANW